MPRQWIKMLLFMLYLNILYINNIHFGVHYCNYNTIIWVLILIVVQFFYIFSHLISLWNSHTVCNCCWDVLYCLFLCFPSLIFFILWVYSPFAFLHLASLCVRLQLSGCLFDDASPSTVFQFLGLLNVIWPTEEAVWCQMGNIMLTAGGELERKCLGIILSLIHQHCNYLHFSTGSGNKAVSHNCGSSCFHSVLCSKLESIAILARP